MKPVLIVRPVRGCDASCSQCPWRETKSGERTYLKKDKLELVLDAMIGSGYRPEVCFICPDPLLHPGVTDLMMSVKERRLPLRVFTPSSTGSEEEGWRSLLIPDEIFLFSYTHSDISGARKMMRYLLSRGANVKVALFITQNTNERELLTCIDLIREKGVQMWISPPIFCPPTVCSTSAVAIMERQGFEVSEPFRKFMDVYMVRVTFRRDFPIYVLDGPYCKLNCGMVFLDSAGYVGKCPVEGTLNMLYSPLEIAGIVRLNCSKISRSTKYSFSASLVLVTKDGRRIYEDDLEILSALADLGSFSRLARALNTSPASIYKRVRSIEKILGINLFMSRKGGSDRGGCTPTPECLELIKRYKIAKSSILSKNLKISQKKNGTSIPSFVEKRNNYT